jgi:riboflavin synthase
MFTGISECIGIIKQLDTLDGVLNIWVESAISSELKIDQSVCHDGICLTVVSVGTDSHQVQVIPETIKKTNIAGWTMGTWVNLERSMPANGRFDGHIVQGHVDGVAVLHRAEQSEGQLELFFEHDPKLGITVSKGSICVNGISLTVVQSTDSSFSVALIPYTRENTNLGKLEAGETANIEFDIIGKYLQKMRG